MFRIVSILLVHALAVCTVQATPLITSPTVLQGFSHLVLPTASRTGLNGEPCDTGSDCRGTRQCLQATGLSTGERTACEASTSCVCVPADDAELKCKNSEECDPGEQCLQYPLASGEMVQTCLSCSATTAAGAGTMVDYGNCNVEPVVPGTPGSDAATGAEPVDETDGNDVGPYEEFVPGSAADEALPSDAPPQPSGEPTAEPGAPAAGFNTDGGAAETDVDAEAEDRDEAPELTTLPTPGAACVAADALAHLPASALVFRAHRTAAVLCDAGGSCATAGHVVVYRGAAMMMETYCRAHATCVGRRMLVNSPRATRGLRVASQTDGLAFTAFAARYGTTVEETVLRTLVRIGM